MKKIERNEYDKHIGEFVCVKESYYYGHDTIQNVTTTVGILIDGGSWKPIDSKVNVPFYKTDEVYLLTNEERKLMMI